MKQIQQVVTLFHGSAFPVVLLMVFTQKLDTRLGLMQTFEDLFKSGVNDKSFEGDVLPVNYRMGILKCSIRHTLSACSILKPVFRCRNICNVFW